MKVVTLLKQRLDAMHVNLNSEIITLVSVMMLPIYKKWLGFAKISLQNLITDAIVLLKGDRAMIIFVGW
jgi:hypothetical protein